MWYISRAVRPEYFPHCFTLRTHTVLLTRVGKVPVHHLPGKSSFSYVLKYKVYMTNQQYYFHSSTDFPNLIWNMCWRNSTYYNLYQNSVSNTINGNYLAQICECLYFVMFLKAKNLVHPCSNPSTDKLLSFPPIRPSLDVVTC
jgi:hypothetical protein